MPTRTHPTAIPIPNPNPNPNPNLIPDPNPSPNPNPDPDRDRSSGAHADCTTDSIVHGVAWLTFALFLLGALVLLVLWAVMDERLGLG